MFGIKILFVHNFYKISGGEDQVFYNEIQSFEEKGFEVLKYTVDNKVLETNKMKYLEGFLAFWNPFSFLKFYKFLKKNKPDIVHFHNLFPLFSPSLYYACKMLNIPCVQTLHNYRILCANAQFLKNGKVCTKCIDESLIHSLRYKCYRNSFFHTLLVNSYIKFNKIAGTWKRIPSKYIVLTQFAKELFIKNGIPEDKLVIKPNFSSYSPKNNIKKEDYFIFVGRISQEKGIDLLLENWVKHGIEQKLIIIGDGPEYEKLTSQYKSNSIQFLGRVSNEETQLWIQRAKFLIMPSIWFEGLPMTFVEAMALGTPVIGSNIGALNELIQNNINGYTIDPNQSTYFMEVIRKSSTILEEEYKYMSENCTRIFKEKYSKNINTQRLIGLYKQLIEGSE